jgi:hypothetical protein
MITLIVQTASRRTQKPQRQDRGPIGHVNFGRIPILRQTRKCRRFQIVILQSLTSVRDPELVETPVNPLRLSQIRPQAQVNEQRRATGAPCS